jgi:hypothetical protein
MLAQEGPYMTAEAFSSHEVGGGHKPAKHMREFEGKPKLVLLHGGVITAEKFAKMFKR